VPVTFRWRSPPPGTTTAESMAAQREQVVPVISVPARFAADTLAREGDAALEWLDSLPALVSELCARWNLGIDGQPMHGSHGLVLPVTQDGGSYVLKVSWICARTATEAVALSAWNGDGAVRLLAEDRTAGAMLLERLDPRRSLAGQSLGVAVPVAGRLLRRLAVPAPEATARALPGLGTWAERLSAQLPDRWQVAGQPFPRRLLAEAVELATALAPAAGLLLIDRDLHYAKVLAARREPWLVIGPEAVTGDVEFGLAPLLWHRLNQAGGPSGLRYRLAALIDAAGLDYDLTRRWTLLRVVDHWLQSLSTGPPEGPARCETITTWLALARIP
jgi:streptomycin 6-kinase